LACSKSFYNLGTGYFDVAIEILAQGRAIYPGNISFYDLAIKIESERKNYNSAIIWLDSLIKRYPKFIAKKLLRKKLLKLLN
jgi:tetratricopeptide (TPR) repeat protein